MYINLDEEREAGIKSCFSCNVDFHYPKSIFINQNLLEVFNARSRTTKKNNDTSSSDDEFFNESDRFGEKTICNQLVVMDDVSGLAE